MAHLQTIVKAGEVLVLFSRQNPEWGVTEMAVALKIPKSNAHQLLSSLETIGLLHRMVTGRYRLGFGLLALGQHLLANTPWRDVASRALLDLAEQTGETTQLAVLDGGQLIFIDVVVGRNECAVQPKNQRGDSISPHKNALGKIMLALKQNKKQKPKAELNKIVRLGYALHTEQEVHSVAAAILNHNGDVIAAIGLSVQKQKNISQTHIQAVVKTAQEISVAIGYDPEFVRENRNQSRTSVGNRLQVSYGKKNRANQ